MDEPKDLQNNPPSAEPIDPLPDIDIPALRTYKGDINRTVVQDKITTAKILITEQKAREKQQIISSETSVSKPKNMFALIFGVIFMIAAVGLVGVFGYEKIINRTPIPTLSTESFFLFAYDEQKYIDASKTRTEVFEEVNKLVIEADGNKDNTYTDLIFYKLNEDTNTNVRISSAEFFQLFEIQLPSVISRAISKDFSYGLYKTGVRVEPFLVIGLADYENAFDSMFDWEDTLALDVRAFFPKLQEVFNMQNTPVEVQQTIDMNAIATNTASSTSLTMSTSTATTTTATSTVVVPAQASVVNRNVTFTDVVLSNRDTRAVRDENGSPYFYYMFLDKDRILFAQDPKLITEIVRKIKEKQLVR